MLEKQTTNLLNCERRFHADYKKTRKFSLKKNLKGKPLVGRYV